MPWNLKPLMSFDKLSVSGVRLVDSHVSLTYDKLEAVLHGELAVPCTRNPLQRG